MSRFATVVLSLLLAACAAAPTQSVKPLDGSLFHDALFAPAKERVDAADVFALSQEMRAFLVSDMLRLIRTKGSQHGLFEALYEKGMLKLEYDAARTRNAAEAFAARAGNCLSLVIMTAAFAKELGMPVHYQNVFTEETWSRSGDFYLAIGHVNVSLGRRLSETNASEVTMTIDFLPPKDLRGLRTWVLDESTIVAMYMNNRAVESLTSGDVDEAYWWVREAVVQDPRFLSAINTLGVVYQLHGDLAEAQRTLEYVMRLEPANTRAMSNLVSVLALRGELVAAQDLRRKLEQIEPNPPFGYYKRGLAAMRDGNYKLAKEMFAKEVDRAAYYHEFHFWLALAYVGLGDMEHARQHMSIAVDNSTTRHDHDLYAAKLERLRASAPVIRR